MALGDAILDHGPVYAETIVGRFPVEPFNTLSNIGFLIILVYWGMKVYPAYKKHKFIAYALPVLFIGFIGGTVYHATRAHDVWLAMDWMPIMILGLSVSVYYYFKQKLPWWGIPILLAIPFVLMYLVFNVLDLARGVGPSIGYSMIALLILLPITLHLYRTKWKHGQWILFGLLSFIVAITFRTLDKYALIPMGTHFLWHLFGALATHFVLTYIWKDGKNTLTSST